jgi:hypothetical protein
VGETTSQFIIDLVKLVKWPVIIVFLPWIFRQALSNVLTSLSSREFWLDAYGVKAKVGSGSAEAEQQQVAKNPFQPEGGEPILELEPSHQLAIEKPEKPSERLSLPMPMASPSQAVARLEKEMRNEVKTLNSALNSEQKEDRLIRVLAETRLRAGHEFIYNCIFGSQIAFLKRLNEVAKLTIDQAREFLKPYADQFPQIYSHYSFEA